MIIFVGSWAALEVIGILVLYAAVFAVKICVSKKLAEHLHFLKILKIKIF
jgi:hypothetical protein